MVIITIHFRHLRSCENSLPIIKAYLHDENCRSHLLGLETVSSKLVLIELSTDSLAKYDSNIRGRKCAIHFMLDSGHCRLPIGEVDLSRLSHR